MKQTTDPNAQLGKVNRQWHDNDAMLVGLRRCTDKAIDQRNP